jgi:hypothetical protein
LYQAESEPPLTPTWKTRAPLTVKAKYFPLAWPLRPLMVNVTPLGSGVDMDAVFVLS